MRARKILRIFNIDIQLHYSWWIIFFLLTWSLAAFHFPNQLSNLSTSTYWFMGIIAALLLFFSVLLHELSHSLVAKSKGIKVESITLFFFGGVAGITREDLEPKSEFFMAIAGPLFSFTLAVIFYGLYKLTLIPIIDVMTLYLAQLNLILGFFNMVPAFPLDGGRAFRAVLHHFNKDLRKATKIAASLGKGFAIFMILFGIFTLFRPVQIYGFYVGGLLFILLGGFLYLVANASYQQVVMKQVLNDVKLKDLVTKVKALDPETTFKDFLKKHKNNPLDTFLVQNKKFSGILDLKQLQLPPKLHSITKLKQIAVPFSQLPKLEGTAWEAFRKFSQTAVDILPSKDGVVRRQTLINRLMNELRFGGEHKIAKKLKKN